MSRRLHRLHVPSPLLVAAAVFCLTVGFAQRSFAEYVELSAAATCTCDPKAGTIIVRYFPSLTEDETRKLKPIVFYRLLKLNKEETTVVGNCSESIVCTLGSEKYKVTLSSGVPNPDLTGRCGGAITGLLSVTRNGAPVLNELEFEALDCHSRERHVVSVTFRPGSEKPEITYAADEVEE